MAYDVTVFLVWHSAIIESALLQFSKTCHDGSVLSNRGVSKAGRGPRVVVSTAAFHARARGSVPGLGGLKETKMFLPHPRVKVSIVGSLRDREVACSASDRQGSNFESCVWKTVSSHHPGPVWPICAQRWPKARFISFVSKALMLIPHLLCLSNL